MLLGSDLLFLHVPRSAGTYITSRIEAMGGGEQVFHEDKRPHVPARELPQEWFTGRRVIASVRNPWDWYVSWIHYFLRQDGMVTGWLKDRIGPEWPGFREAIKICIEPTGDLARECRTYSTSGPRQTLKEQASAGIGLYTWLFHETLCETQYESLPVHMCKPLTPDTYIDASGDVAAALSRLLGRDVPPSEPVNQGGFGEAHTPHGPPGAYYDTELIELVARYDSELIHRFGYQAPGTSATKGVI